MKDNNAIWFLIGARYGKEVIILVLGVALILSLIIFLVVGIATLKAYF